MAKKGFKIKIKFILEICFLIWYNYIVNKKEIKKERGDNMFKASLLKRLHAIIIEIAKANNEDLDKIGVELAEIEKKLLLCYNVL